MQFAGVFNQDDPFVAVGEFGQQRIGKRCLARAGPARDEDVEAVSHAGAKGCGLLNGHDPGSDIVFEQKHCDGGLADREGWCGYHRWQKAFKPLPAFRQLGRHAGSIAVDFGPDMMSDQADYALPIGSG